MDRRTIAEIAQAYADRRIVILGDVMVDEFLRGTVDRISPEAPVPVLEFSSHTFVLGGAANVAHNVVALGGQAALVGAIGDDLPGERLLEGLSQVGIMPGGVTVVPGRRTTLKTRVLAHTQHVVRIDREDRTAVPPEAEEQLVSRVREALGGAAALLISDYNKGAVTPAVARGAIAAAREGGLSIVVDTKHHDVKPFAGATVLTPNVRELEELSRVKAVDDAALARAAQALITRLELEGLLVTRAEEGMSLFDKSGARGDVAALAIEVHDITGAGDTVAAALTAALAAGRDLSDAAQFANLAAAVVVRKLGTATASVQEIAAFVEHNG